MGLSGHAWFETYSVLTRLPAPARRSPSTVATLLSTNFPASRALSAKTAERLRVEMASVGIAGGAVYDALVGAAAREHGVPLVSADRRASETYRALGVEVEFISAS